MGIERRAVVITGVPDDYEVEEVRPAESVGGKLAYSVVFKKAYTPEPWLKEAGFRWIWRLNQHWYASLDKPVFNRGWQLGSIETHLKPLNFTPPELPEGTADKDTLIEL